MRDPVGWLLAGQALVLGAAGVVVVARALGTI